MSASRHPGGQSADDEAALLAVVDSVRRELQPAHFEPAHLHSSLERELGLDSLARVEVLHRIEREFGMVLPDTTLAEAETVMDLLAALRGASPELSARSATAAGAAPSLAVVEGRPDQASTLIEALDWHVAAHGDRTHVQFYRTPAELLPFTYAQLRGRAASVAAGLRAGGVEPGQAVAIMLPTSLDFFASFYGALLCGGIPVPMYPPARPSQIEDHLRRQAGILANCRAPVLITVPEAKLVSRLLAAQVPTLRSVVTMDELDQHPAEPMSYRAQPEDIAFIQYTSGSTGNPKGVVLTHANLLANIRAWGRATRLVSTDVCVSWLPLYHDMGLIGTWLGSLYYAFPLVLMSPLDFLARPERWLWAIHRHRGTVSAAPNFAFELCLRRVSDAAIEGLDLGTLRLVVNGAEPVSPDTIERFCERFARYGFRCEAMAPVYGLAECTVGLATPPLGRRPLVDRIAREPFVRDGRAIPAPTEDAHALRIVACGQPLPGHEIRIVDDAGRELPERAVGRLEFRGPSATRGYYRNPEATQAIVDGEWLHSGDYAYISGGDVYITGRAKDIIIRGGRNLYPYELEEEIGNMAGIRKGCVAVFGVPDHVAGTERLVVLAETREREVAQLQSLRERINAFAVDLLGAPADDVVLAPPHSVLKTSSGKIRRAATRDLYMQGAIGVPGRAVWRQMASLACAGIGSWLARTRRAAAAALYAVYVWIVFLLMAPVVWGAVAVSPGGGAAWSLSRLASRAFLRLTGLGPDVRGLGNMPANGSCVLVANHASYLDGMVLVAVLPRPVAFVAKQELTRSVWTRIPMVRLGAEFVERFDVEQSVADARRLVDGAGDDRCLFYFAEGTFSREPGLRPFKMGAFVSAARAGFAVVPVSLRGTRSVLRDKTWFPRHGPILVTLGAPISPEGYDWQAAVKLRDAARAAILPNCGEPDLAQ